MDASSAVWPGEWTGYKSYEEWLAMGTDNYNMIQECIMELAEFTNDPDIAAKLGLSGNLQQSFSSESFSSYSTPFNETSQTRFERPSKQTKTNSWNPAITTDHLSPVASPTSQFLSFDQSNSVPPTESKQLDKNIDYSLKPNDEAASPPANIHLPRHLGLENSLDSQNYATKANNHGTNMSYSMTKSRAMPTNRILADRKRREELSQGFIALLAIVPGLKKTDKASVLGGTIEYVKKLKKQVKDLKEQTKKRSVESVVFVKKSQFSADDELLSDEICDNTFDSALPEIEARASDKDVLIRIRFEKQKGLLPKLLTKILSDIEGLQLSIGSVLPFGNSTLELTIIAQKNDDFRMTMKEFVKELRQAILKFVKQNIPSSVRAGDSMLIQP